MQAFSVAMKMFRGLFFPRLSSFVFSVIITATLVLFAFHILRSDHSLISKPLFSTFYNSFYHQNAWEISRLKKALRKNELNPTELVIIMGGSTVDSGFLDIEKLSYKTSKTIVNLSGSEINPADYLATMEQFRDFEGVQFLLGISKVRFVFPLNYMISSVQCGQNGRFPLETKTLTTIQNALRLSKKQCSALPFGPYSDFIAQYFNDRAHFTKKWFSSVFSNSTPTPKQIFYFRDRSNDTVTKPKSIAPKLEGSIERQLAYIQNSRQKTLIEVATDGDLLFRALIKNAEKWGHKIIIFEQPTDSQERDAWNIEATQRYSELIRNYAALGNHVTLKDFRGKFSDDDFYDAYHLRWSGRKKFQQEIGDIIQPNIKPTHETGFATLASKEKQKAKIYDQKTCSDNEQIKGINIVSSFTDHIGPKLTILELESWLLSQKFSPRVAEINKDGKKVALISGLNQDFEDTASEIAYGTMEPDGRAYVFSVSHRQLVSLQATLSKSGIGDTEIQRGLGYWRIDWLDEEGQPLVNISPTYLKVRFPRTESLIKDYSFEMHVEPLSVPYKAKKAKLVIAPLANQDYILSELEVLLHDKVRIETPINKGICATSLQKIKLPEINLSLEEANYQGMIVGRGVRLDVDPAIFQKISPSSFANKLDKVNKPAANFFLNRFNPSQIQLQSTNNHNKISVTFGDLDAVIVSTDGGSSRIELYEYITNQRELVTYGIPPGPPEGGKAISSFHTRNFGLSRFLNENYISLGAVRRGDIAVTPRPSGYESTFIFTNHADYQNHQVDNVLFFGTDKVKGLLDYPISVTNTVFVGGKGYNISVGGISHYVQPMEESGPYIDFYKDIISQYERVEIGLHTLTPIGDSPKNYSKYFSVGRQLNAKVWIDHGSASNLEGIERMGSQVATINHQKRLGIIPAENLFILDDFAEYGIKYGWIHEFIWRGGNSVIDNASDRLLYSVPRLNALGGLTDFHIFGSQWGDRPTTFTHENLQKLIDEAGVWISHTYLQMTPFMEFDNTDMKTPVGISQYGTQFLADLSQFIRDKKIWNPTLSKWADYTLAVRKTQLYECDDGLCISNSSGSSIQGFTLLADELSAQLIRTKLLENNTKFTERAQRNNRVFISFDLPQSGI